MPRFGGVLSALQAKLEEARISDLNYELGKIAQGSRAYVGSYIKSTRLWGSGGGSGNKEQPLPKSTSLPAFPSSSSNGQKSQEEKYRYRSTFQEPEAALSEADEHDIVDKACRDANVVERFIKVIESKEQISCYKNKLSSREEIRKKLAFSSNNSGGDSGDANGYRSKFGSTARKAAGDLEVCFINEIIEEEEVLEGGDTSSLPLTRSRSDFFDGGFQQQKDEEEEDLQSKAATALANCSKIAKRQILLDKTSRAQADAEALKKLIGKDIDKFTLDTLGQLNTATLQVIVNDYHSKIEGLNEELVRLLIEKDELQIEQDGQLVDIDDLSQPVTRNRIA